MSDVESHLIDARLTDPIVALGYSQYAAERIAAAQLETLKSEGVSLVTLTTPCPTCDGEELHEQVGNGEWEIVPCPSCGGSGEHQETRPAKLEEWGTDPRLASMPLYRVVET